MEDVKTIMALLTDVSGSFSEATEKRQQTRSFCRQPQLPTTKAWRNSFFFVRKEQLPADKMSTISAKELLEVTLKQAKEEAEKTNKMLIDFSEIT